MKKSSIVTAIACVTLCAAGCANRPHTPPRQDDFFKQWHTAAETSKGYSAPPKENVAEVTDIFTTLEQEAGKEGAQTVRPLPQTPVSLKFHEVDVGVVMRVLASAAGKNIVMSDGVGGPISVDIQQTPWDQAFLSILEARGLTYTWVGDVIRVMSVEDLRRDIEIEKIRNERLATSSEARKLEPLQTAMIRIRYAKAEGLRENLEKFLTKNEKGEPRGSVSVDTHNNALIIQAIAADTERMLRLIQKLDQPRAQVLLKAHIVETTKDTARELGVQWGGRYRSSPIGNNDRLFVSPGDGATIPGTRPDREPWGGTSPVGPVVNFPADVTGGGASLSLMYGVIDGNILEFQLSALQSEGKLNILSSPSITTLDNQMAFTENGERVPFASIDEDGTMDVEWEDAVLRLEITPNIIDDQQLKLAIKVKKDEVDLSRTVMGNPFIIKKQTETNLVVANGETIVISGLSRERSTLGEDGVPGLKDIPGLGHLFRRDSRGQIMEDVLIFITPTILPYRPVTEGSAKKDDLG
jgi:type IV pilus assembly protein PilQ